MKNSTSLERLVFVATIGVAALVGCQKASGDSSNVSAEARAEADQIFTNRCAACHGATGVGDGNASKGLNPAPRNLQEKEWQSSVNDEYIEKIIRLGGLGVGKSAAMPPNPDLGAKPEVVMALRERIRSLSK
jgi:mono/diheme cytochrome c family protein